MKPFLQTLDSNEAILLMYLANELPADEHAEVEAMLKSDSGFRRELESLRTAHAQMSAAFGSSDAASTPLLSEEAIARQTSALLKKWTTRRVLQYQEPAQRGRGRWIIYGGGIAAALMFGYIGYWGIWGKLPTYTNSLSPNNMVAVVPDGSGDPATNVIPQTDPQPETLTAADRTDLLQQSFDQGPGTRDDAIRHPDLSAAEDQIQVVAELSDPAAINGDLDFH